MKKVKIISLSEGDAFYRDRHLFEGKTMIELGGYYSFENPQDFQNYKKVYTGGKGRIYFFKHDGFKTEEINLNKMKIEITKERIIEAASKCSQAKETLKTLFPEVFEEDKKVDLSYDSISCFKNGYNQLTVFSKKDDASLIFIDDNTNRFGLHHKFNWEFVKEGKETYLIPTRKDD